MISSTALWLGIAFCLGLFVFVNSRWYWMRLPLPPGPPVYSYLRGTKFESHVWRQFGRLTKVYGDIFTVWVGGTPYIILGSVAAVKDVMELQGHATAARPALLIPSRMTRNRKVSLMAPSTLWKNSRMLLKDATTATSARKYESTQIRFAHVLIRDLLEFPEDYNVLVQKFAASIVMNLAYGRKAPASHTDPEIDRVIQVMVKLAVAGVPGKWFVDAYPGLQVLPGWMLQNWKAIADKAYYHELNLHRENMETVAKKMVNGTAEPCVCVDVLENKDRWHMNDDEMAYVVGGIFAAGSDTTNIGTLNAILASLVYPEKQKKAQSYIDKVCGDRPPLWEDRPQLVYLEAYMEEVTRWRTPIPMGIYHAASEDIWYKGYLIPKGAGIMAPHHLVHQDPEVYPDGENFIPERWLKPRASEDDPMEMRDDLVQFTFGYGLRACPGKEIALRSLWIGITTILWAFDIVPKKDPKTGKNIPVDVDDYLNGAISAPNYFSVEFKPRFPIQHILKAMEVQDN